MFTYPIFSPPGDYEFKVTWWHAMEEATGANLNCSHTGGKWGNASCHIMTDFNTVPSITGKVNNGKDYNGAGTGTDYHRASDTAMLLASNMNRDCSLMGYVYLDAKAQDMTIVCLGTDASNYDYQLYYDLGTDRFVFDVYDGATTKSVTASSFGSPSTATWYFWYIEYNAATDTIGISIDNGPLDTTSGVTGITGNGIYLLFGGRWATAQRLDGRLDEVRYVRQLLTSAQRRAMMNVAYADITATYPMIFYDGSSRQYDTGCTYSGHKQTVIGGFKKNSFTGDKIEYLFSCNGSTQIRLAAAAVSSDYTAATDRRDRIQIFGYDSAGSLKLFMVTDAGYLDGNPHSFLFDWDGDAGTAQCIIDGTDVYDSGITGSTIQTATMSTGAGAMHIGASSAGTQFWNQNLAIIGSHDVAGLSYSDFFRADYTPNNAIDTSTWTEFTSQPQYYNPAGFYIGGAANYGTEGNCASAGTILFGYPW